MPLIRAVGLGFLTALLIAAAAPPSALADCVVGPCPPPAPSAAGALDLSSTYGSGSLGRWRVDQFGLPAYLYSADETRDAAARQPELGGATRAQHQLGNDHIVAAAFNDGYTQFWSQDRLTQWANLFQPGSRHYAGGFGWLRIGDRRNCTGRHVSAPRSRHPPTTRV